MERLDLNGKWLARWADGQRGGLSFHRDGRLDPVKWIDAQVPGEIHLDLIKAGIIEEPYTGTNCLKCRWVEDCVWTYRKVFAAPEEALSAPAWLHFEGLDYEAKIYLNGEVVGTHANFYRPAFVEVTGKLKPGDNVLLVELESGLYHVSEKPVTGHHGNCGDMPLHKRVWLRKPQCSFGWDWSTRLINLGIHKPAWLEWDKSLRAEQLSALASLSDDLATGTVRARAAVKSFAAKPLMATLSVGTLGKSATAELEVKPGDNVLDVELKVDSPKLWWPNGHGAQTLHAVRVELRQAGRLVAAHDTQVGFRKIHVNQEPHPERGTYFIFEINNRKIFAKGANYVPADMIFASVDRERSRNLVDLAVDANFNFLRVWGGGLYESDDFYSRCDERGVMVWQDFMYACGGYPATDAAFMANVTAEALFTVRRLAPHPSLVAYCGNNEQEWQTFNQTTGVVRPDYSLYHLVLPRMLLAEDPTRHYQPSSPYSPGFEHPNASHTGDQHPWGIGFDNVDFRQYRGYVCRFPNEGGCLGPTALPTMLECLPEGQRQLHSFAWQIHDNGVEQWFPDSAPDKLVKEWLGLDPRSLSIADFVFHAGLVQGEALREYIGNYRRRKFSSAAAVFWMFNDCWPAVRSWTIVDHRLRRTPSFHPVRRAFAPVSVVVAKDGGKVQIHGVNDSMEPWTGTVRHGVFALAGEHLLDEAKPAAIPPNASVVLAEFPDDAWAAAGFDRALAFAALLGPDGDLAARGRLILPKFHELAWPGVRELAVRRDGAELVFSSPTFAMGVCLDLDGEAGLPDNFFDVWPGMDYRLPWPEGKRPPKALNYLS